jgi:hypothetical protein
MLGWELLRYFIKIRWLDGDRQPTGAGKETLHSPTSAINMMANIVENSQVTDTIPGAGAHLQMSPGMV